MQLFVNVFRINSVSGADVNLQSVEKLRRGLATDRKLKRNKGEGITRRRETGRRGRRDSNKNTR